MHFAALSRSAVAPALLAVSAILSPHPALAWGDEGHRVVALLAERFLNAAVREKVSTMLAADPDDLTAHDIASEANWADRYRDSDRRGLQEHYRQTRQWHFVDVEISDPNLDAACFGHPQLPPATPASNGPAQDCIVDKVEQFAAELGGSKSNSEEQLVALKFLLHLVGDLHQPLHAADDHDAGGNRKRVVAPGFRPGNLHHYWDTEFVERLGPDPRQIAAGIADGISEQQQKEWSRGSAADWAKDSFEIARRDAYGRLPEPEGHGVYALDRAYIDAAMRDVQLQLGRASVRLATVLNGALGEPQ